MGGGTNPEAYLVRSRPGVKYTPITGGVRAEITLAYEKPVKSIGAILGTAACKVNGDYGLSFDIYNAGTKYIAWRLNNGGVKPALAVKELDLKKARTAEDGLVKIFTWDIAGNIRPPDGEKAMMMINVVADDGHGNVVETVTGLIDGYLDADNTGLQTYPDPLPGICTTCTDDSVTDPYTDIHTPTAAENIKIGYASDGFTITGGGENWVIRTVTGLQITSGKGAFVPKNGLPKGIYLLTVANTQGGKETQKIIVR